MENQTKRALPILFAVMFLVMLGFGIIIPVLPFYVEVLGGDEFLLGVLMAVYSVMQFLFAPVWGSISDRIGRKPVMLIGIAGLSLSFFLFAVADSIAMLFVARIVGGILSAANMPTVMAYVADVTTPENRGKGMGVIGASIGLGFIFGPAIGGIFSGDGNYSLPFYIAGFVSAVTFLFVLLMVKESLSPEKRAAAKTAKKESRWKAFGGSMSYLYFLTFVVTASLAGLEATFAYFAAVRADLSVTDLGYIFMIMGLAGAFVQGGLVGRLIKKRGEGTVIQLGLIISAVGFGLILLVESFATAALFLTIFGIGNGLIRPSVNSLVTKRTQVGQGQATGLLSSFDSLGRIAGPALGAALYTWSIGLPYITGIVLSLVALMLYRLYLGKSKANQQPAHS